MTACDSTETDDPGDGTTDGPSIVGDWISAGANLGVYISTTVYPNLDSIYATFGSDNSYSQRFVNDDASAFTLSGTYVSTASSVEGIYNITINQTSPLSETYVGIFQVTETQLELDVVLQGGSSTAATPEGGIGSSSLGADNVQTYVRQ